VGRLSEQNDASAIEGALPGSSVSVEEIALPSDEPVSVAVIEGSEAERPHDEMEVGYRFGRMEARVAELEAALIRSQQQLAAFEEATVAAVEAEAEILADQGEVVAAVAEEVLPDDDETAKTHNPDHGSKRPPWWAEMLGGCRKKMRGGGE